MKNLVIVILATVLFALANQAIAEQPPGFEVHDNAIETQTVLGIAEPQPNQLNVLPTTASTDDMYDPPRCWIFQGNSCPSPGAVARCMWQPYEPGICFCGNDNVWSCG